MRGRAGSRLLGAALPAASRAGGGLLRGAVGLVGLFRRGERPLHPRGVVLEGRLERWGSPRRTGVPWFDDPGQDEAVVRISAAAGLPAPCWDVQGLAVRVPSPDGSWADLLLATTGSGRWTRYLLRPASPARPGTLTTLLPYAGPEGPVVLGARIGEDGSCTLAHARARGPWTPFARLVLGREVPVDVRFDPVHHPLPGLATYGWVRRLRDPSYRAARAGRRGLDGRRRRTPRG